jgi:hypothetical protein
MKRLPLLVLFLSALAAVSAYAQPLMDGYIDYWPSHNHTHVHIDDITNFSDQPTGPLRLRLYATRDAWSADHRGRLLGGKLLGELPPNGHWSHIDRTINISEPNGGWYRITLSLEEKTIKQSTGTLFWRVRDAVEFYYETYYGRHSDWYWPHGWW